MLLEDDTRVITGFGRSPVVKLTSVLTFMGGGGDIFGLVCVTCASAVARIRAACNNEVFVILPEFKVGGDDGSVAVGKVIDEGGLSLMGVGMITELSSMYLKSAPSIPTSTSKQLPSPFINLTTLALDDSDCDGGLSDTVGLHLNSDGGGMIL